MWEKNAIIDTGVLGLDKAVICIIISPALKKEYPFEQQSTRQRTSQLSLDKE
jgi:hypothetical protein